MQYVQYGNNYQIFSGNNIQGSNREISPEIADEKKLEHAWHNAKSKTLS